MDPKTVVVGLLVAALTEYSKRSDRIPWVDEVNPTSVKLAAGVLSVVGAVAVSAANGSLSHVDWAPVASTLYDAGAMFAVSVVAYLGVLKKPAPVVTAQGPAVQAK